MLDNAASDQVVWLLRCIVSTELQSREDHYLPFILVGLQ
jgi:hypothetical protein